METNTIDEMVTAVRSHAIENYNNDGWDYIIECYSSKELEEEILRLQAKNNDEAIRRIGLLVGILDDRRQDIRATAW